MMAILALAVLCLVTPDNLIGNQRKVEEMGRSRKRKAKGIASTVRKRMSAGRGLRYGYVARWCDFHNVSNGFLFTDVQEFGSTFCHACGV